PFADGCAPPDSVVEAFLEILDASLYRRSKKRSESDASPPPCVAIHCISGLGRSPAMVALGLIEREKMEPSEAIRLVRKLRSSRCLTKEQSTFLLNYVPRHRRKSRILGCLCSPFRRRPARKRGIEGCSEIVLSRAESYSTASPDICDSSRK
ncbi:Protein tyrosine phosphatase type IVA 1, partial [Perkinsus olseni]